MRNFVQMASPSRAINARLPRNRQQEIFLYVASKTWLLLAAFLLIQGVAKAQTISLSEKDASLVSVFKKIESQTGYHFWYEDRTLTNAKKVTIQVSNEELATVLEKCFSGQPLTYSIVQKTIVVKVKEQQPSATAARDELVNVSGKVSSSKGEPLTGITVSEKRASGKATATDADGDYTLTGIPASSIITVSGIGYKDEEARISGRLVINFTLETEAADLQEVVVTGYQNIQKRLFTGASTKLKSEDVKMDGVVDVSRMLEGRAAGVSIQNVSGTFGAAPKVRVRGATSITGENKPLWVVDNIVLEDIVNISNDQLSSGDPSTLLGSAVAGLNADDIESFEILKDASATALYGARAMNGVIVITTKKGKSGKPSISYNANLTVFMKPNYNTYNIMNSADQMSVYAEMQRKGWFNFSDVALAQNGGVFTKMNSEILRYDEQTGSFGLENTPAAKADFLRRYAGANTDWFDLLFRNSLIQEHSVSISSGTETARHYFSTSFYNNTGWSLGESVKRYTANFRSDYKFGNRITAATSVNASVRRQTAPGTQARSSDVVEGRYSRDFDINPFSYALNTSRTLTAYDENGNLEYFTNSYAPFNIINELDNNSIKLGMTDVKLQGEFGYKIAKNLNYTFLGALRYVKTSREHMIRENSNMAGAYRANYNSLINDRNRYLYQDPDHPDDQKVVVLPQGGFYNRTEDELLNYNLRNMITWKKEIGSNHLINVLAGQEIKYTDRQTSFNNGFGYQYDKGGVPFTDYHIVKQMLEGNYNYYGMGKNFDRFVAFFANASYAYKEKYIFNGTLRYDGSNRMGKSSNARWLPTWTASGAWNMEQENFLRDKDFIDYLKLRASYGLTASIGDATNSSVVLQNTSTLRPFLSDVESQIYISSLENSELTWEKQYETNLGVDLSLWKGLLSLTVDVYNRKGFDLIGQVRTDGIGGQSSKSANYANMKSKGIEVTIGARLVKTANWTYRTNFTFGYNKNTITNLKNTPRIYDLIIPEGGPLEGSAVRGLYSIVFTGLDPFTGVPTFTNEAGLKTNNVYIQSRDVGYLKYEGPVDPTITGGLNNTVTYKNLSLNIFISYQASNKIRLNPEYGSSYSDMSAMPREFLDRWTLPGDEAITNVPSILSRLDYDRLGSVYPYNTYNYSDVRVADGSFVRLKSASLQYSLAPLWLKKIGMRNLSLNFIATNIWLIYADKKLKGQDPEFFASGGVAMPMPRQYTLAVKLGL